MGNVVSIDLEHFLVKVGTPWPFSFQNISIFLIPFSVSCRNSQLLCNFQRQNSFNNLMVTCKYKKFKFGGLFKCLIFSMSFENFEYIILIIGGFTFSRLTNSENEIQLFWPSFASILYSWKWCESLNGNSNWILKPCCCFLCISINNLSC